MTDPEQPDPQQPDPEQPDPGQSDPGAPAEALLRPRKLRIVGALLGGLLTVFYLVGWLLLDPSIRARVSISQALTLVLILALILFILAALAASSVRADEHGLVIRNGLAVHRVEWWRVHKFLLRPGDPWGVVLLKPEDGSPIETNLDTDKLQMMGIQNGDGDLAKSSMQTLRAVHRRYA
ncbi:MAG: PH domain-containing protein [Propionibacteriaceae bacterium]